MIASGCAALAATFVGFVEITGEDATKLRDG